MAIFNPTPSPTNDPTYGQTSRVVQSEAVVDRTYEAALKGAGAVLDATVKGIDAKIKSDIDADLYQSIDTERDAFGVGDTAAMAAHAGSPLDKTKEGAYRGERLPQDMIHLGPQVERLNEAHAAGKLSSRYYYARLESLVRSVRNRYPGYREYIDQKVSQITGVTPANALRASILQDIEDQTKTGKTEQDRRLQLVKELGQYVDADITQQFIAGQRSPEEFVYIASRRQKAMKDLDHLRNIYAYGEAKDKRDSKTVMRNLNDRGRVIMTDLINRGNEKIPGGVKAIFEQIEQVRAGNIPIKDEESQRWALQIENVIAQARNILRKEANLSQEGSPAPSTVLGSEEVEKWVTGQLQPLIDMRDALHSKDYGIVGLRMRQAKAIADDDKYSVLTSEKFGNFSRTLQLWREVAGETGAAAFIMQNLATQQQAIMDFILPTISTQEEFVKKFNRPFNLKDATEIVIDLGQNTPEMKEAIIKLGELVHNPKIADEMSERIARGLFSQGNYGFITEKMPRGEQMNAFYRLTKPDMTKKIVALGNPDLTEDYKFWAKNEFTTLFRQHVQDAQKLTHSPDVKLYWDTENEKFVLDVLPDRPGAVQGYNKHVYGPIITELNKGLSSLKEVLKIDGDMSASYLMVQLQAMGYDPNAPAPTPFIQLMFDALKGAIIAPDATTPVNKQGGRKG